MLKKTIHVILLFSLVIWQSTLFPSRQIAAESNEMLEMAMLLPESDIVVTMDFNRTINIAGPSLLGQDAKKIEHLKSLMKTIEDQIGLNPYEIRQFAAGIRLPPGDSKDFIGETEFTTVIRTEKANGNLLDTWSKKIDRIMAFREEQAPTRGYMNEFKRFRDFKFDQATPEKTAAAAQGLQLALKKTQQVTNALDALPKLSATPKSIGDVKAGTAVTAAQINKILQVLQTDTDMKKQRAESIKLLNRWNAVTLDDPQRTAKLAGLLKESKVIYPDYRKKFENRRKIEDLMEVFENSAEAPFMMNGQPLSDVLNKELDKIIQTLGALPPQKIKRTAALNSLAKNLEASNSMRDLKLAEASSGFLIEPPLYEGDGEIQTVSTVKEKSTDFSETLKKAQREENVNGKRMVVIDLTTIMEPKPTETISTEIPSNANISMGNTSMGNTSMGNTWSGNTSIRNTSIGNTSVGNTSTNRFPRERTPVGNTSLGNTSLGNISTGNISTGNISTGNTNVEKVTVMKEPSDEMMPGKFIPDLAVGFLDEKTMAVGLERTVRAVLMRDANYKNQKAAEMLNFTQNSLCAFAVNSNVVQRIASEAAKAGGNNSGIDLSSAAFLSKFIKNVNIYGSVNYDETSGVTNDITMSLGFYRSQVEELLPPAALPKDDPDADNTFEIAGYEVGKDLFYDLLNSFKAMQGSLTFKFEKKKVVAFAGSVPQIIDTIMAKNTTRPKPVRKSAKTKRPRLESLPDLLTAPQFYTDLAGLLVSKN